MPVSPFFRYKLQRLSASGRVGPGLTGPSGRRCVMLLRTSFHIGAITTRRTTQIAAASLRTISPAHRPQAALIGSGCGLHPEPRAAGRDPSPPPLRGGGVCAGRIRPRHSEAALRKFRQPNCRCGRESYRFQKGAAWVRRCASRYTHRR